MLVLMASSPWAGWLLCYPGGLLLWWFGVPLAVGAAAAVLVTREWSLSSRILATLLFPALLYLPSSFIGHMLGDRLIGGCMIM
jgi:hypothetical protein